MFCYFLKSKLIKTVIYFSKLVASTHGDHNIYITELSSGKLINTLRGHPRTPWCIAFHPTSSEVLASGCLGGQVSRLISYRNSI